MSNHDYCEEHEFHYVERLGCPFCQRDEGEPSHHSVGEPRLSEIDVTVEVGDCQESETSVEEDTTPLPYGGMGAEYHNNPIPQHTDGMSVDEDELDVDGFLTGVFFATLVAAADLRDD